ncbi:DUF3473 domain-containing protein [soil metagenome]
MNILSIDLEDWFHLLAHEETALPQQWEKFESRIERNTDWLLEQLSLSNQRATFFCLGWIAQRNRNLVKRIIDSGHEIGCHSMNHRLVYEQTPAEFKADLFACIRLLQDISGKEINTYRAPGFSVSEQNKWVFEILTECGIEIDCSVFPVARNHGGYQKFPTKKPCIISINGMSLKEFPMSISSFGPQKYVFSGGGYFRLLQYSFIKYQMNRTDYVMTYFHPRDFDPAQPVISTLPLKRKFMSYVGLKSSKEKLIKLLADFRFLNIREAVDQIDWNMVPIVVLD